MCSCVVCYNPVSLLCFGKVLIYFSQLFVGLMSVHKPRPYWLGLSDCIFVYEFLSITTLHFFNKMECYLSLSWFAK